MHATPTSSSHHVVAAANARPTSAATPNAANAARLTAAGLAIGLGAAAALTRYLEAMLFGITPLDAVTFVAAPVVLALVALVACFLPARRATSIDPMIALRCE